MNKAFSIYLDIVRFGAAVLVYLYHSNQRWLSTELLPLSNYGHSSVIVFFVLSGFVIAYITDTKERDWRSYTASRLARVYSVVLPALILCLALDAVGRQLNAAPYSGYPFDQLLVRIGASLLMLNEVWWVSITSLSNVPFWSITFELWYYVLFGMVMFLPRRWGIGVALVLLALLGPKIALLAPLWGLGVLLYRWKALEDWPVPLATMLALASAVGIVLVHSLGLLEHLHAQLALAVGERMAKELTFAKFFTGDYVLAVLVFIHFAAMRVVAPRLLPLFRAVERPVRWLASYTFTLYLLHQPLFLFWGSVLKGDPAHWTAWAACTALVAASVWAVGLVTENKREPLRQWIKTSLQRIGRPAAQAA